MSDAEKDDDITRDVYIENNQRQVSCLTDRTSSVTRHHENSSLLPELEKTTNGDDDVDKERCAQTFKNTADIIRAAVRMKKIATKENKKHIPNVVRYLMFQDSTAESVESVIGSTPTLTVQSTNIKEFVIEMLSKKISLLLVFFPLGYLSHAWDWPAMYTFWFNFLAMVPLANMLGDFTEELAMNTNQVIGGLLNATFGNAVEVVVAIKALLANEIRVVQASMIGSIFSNLLLVLGCCLFFGGLANKHQKFNCVAVSANMSLLALASLSLVLPTPFAQYYDIEDGEVLNVSRIAALFLMFMYAQLLIFQLKTHSHLFEDEDDDLANISFWQSLTGLTLITALITLSSDWLVASIDGFVEESGLSKTFVGVILLPIVGNAVEHITAVNVAMKNKMDLALAIAIGSCTQIALFVIPLIVLVGWCADKDMTLNFPHFEIILFILSIWITSVCLGDANSNWLLGSLLITTYFMIATAFWFESVVNY